MGQENEIKDRLRAFNGYQITPALLDFAAKDVCFLHCLPAHKGEEILKTYLLIAELTQSGLRPATPTCAESITRAPH